MNFTLEEKNWLSYKDAVDLYGISYNTVKKLATEAKAVVYWGEGNRIPRVNRKVFESYFERLLS